MHPTFLLLPCITLLFSPEPDPLALFRQWRRSPSAELRIQAARSLRGCSGREARVALFSLLDDTHPGVRAAARAELSTRAPDEGPEMARELAALRKPRARAEGVRVLVARKEDATLLASDPHPEVRARALATARVDRSAVQDALGHRDGRVRALALERLADPAHAKRFARDRAEEARIAAARVTDDAGVLAALLADRSWRVRLAAIRACERRRDPATLPDLIGVLDGPPGRVRARAVAALETLTRIGFGGDAGKWKKWWARAGAGFRFPETPVKVRREYTSAVPRFRRIPVASLRVCFVLDASRSMDSPAPGGKGKSRWELVVRDLLGVLDRLSPKARFNVVLFRTGVEAWRKRLVPATRGARSACRKWIEAAEPGGWTNLYDSLRLALSDDDVDAVYVLTDGVPSRGAETRRADILGEIAYLNRYRLVQINCVQAGADKGLSKRWRGFLETLAKAHDGIAVRE